MIILHLILNLFFILFFLILFIVLYFAPTIIAYKRKHINATAIFILNLFLGWTFLGRVLSLVWAYTKQ